MKESQNQKNQYNSHTLEKLQHIEKHVSIYLKEFEKYHSNFERQKDQSYRNTQKIHHFLMLFLSNSFKPLSILLLFLEDKDIMRIAGACKLAYKIIYSPLGYKITMQLRPPIYKLKTKQKKITFSEIALKNLCQDRNLQGLQQDDKMAIIMTMKTNLFAKKQKIRELDKQNKIFEKQNQKLITQLTQINLNRQKYQKKIYIYKQEIQKFAQTMNDSMEYLKRLKQQHDNLISEKQKKLQILDLQKVKLIRHKQLLIKKIKTLEVQKKQRSKQISEGNRIFNLMKKISLQNTKDKL